MVALELVLLAAIGAIGLSLNICPEQISPVRLWLELHLTSIVCLWVLFKTLGATNINCATGRQLAAQKDFQFHSATVFVWDNIQLEFLGSRELVQILMGAHVGFAIAVHAPFAVAVDAPRRSTGQ